MQERRAQELIGYLHAARKLSAQLPAVIAELVNLGFRDAAMQAATAVARLPGERAADYEALGFVAFNLGLHELSRDCYAKVVAVAPKDSLGWYNLASAERNVGAFDAAQESCNRALALDPQQLQAALLRSSLRVQRANGNHVADLQDRLRAIAPGNPGRIFLHYALGKELDDLGDFESAWEHFALGAAARRQTLQYDVAEDLRKLRRIEEVFDGRGQIAPTMPVRHGFIVGLPRSGTTLVERVLTTRDDVATNGETDNLLGALMEGLASSGGDIFERVAAADPRIVANSYRRRAGSHGGARLILEKMPLNYLYLGAIARTLPDARIVVLRRNLIDNCFGMFTTLFGVAYPFSYAFADLAAYAIAFDRLLCHWQAVLGERIHLVDYDSFVSEPSRHGRAFVQSFGLEWSEEMLRVELNRRPTSTASAEQVRRPIYTTASKRWRNYESQLAPLVELLAKAGLV